jgi:preprotein translocase subunit YajC
MLMPVLLVIGVFYFVMIGPERKQRKARERMLGALKKGDRVITTSGMHATVVGIQEDVLTLQADEGVRLKFNRGAVQSVQNAGEKEASAK